MAYNTPSQPKINCCLSTVSGFLLLTGTGQEEHPRTAAERWSLAPGRQWEELAQAEVLFNDLAPLPGKLREIQGWTRGRCGWGKLGVGFVSKGANSKLRSPAWQRLSSIYRSGGERRQHRLAEGDRASTQPQNGQT